MQIEKVKMRPPAGTAWNGTASRGSQHGHNAYGCAGVPGEHAVSQYTHSQPPSHYGGSHPDMTTPQQLSPVAPEPTISILQNPNRPPTPVAPVPAADDDADFPRRMPPSSRTPSLYDPSAPVPFARPVRHSPVPPLSHAPPAQQPPMSPMSPSAPSAPQASTTPVIVTASTPNEADVEARMSGLSLKPRQPPSYAKIVRRD
jgi:hypothetical protein